jgi:hypothetical protein
MTRPGYDVTSQPAMPPPPIQDGGHDGVQDGGLAKSADPRHNAPRGETR